MLKWLWRRRRLDDETRPEFETHLELLVDRYIRSGMTPDDARASDAVWRARFSSDPSVVGTTIHLSAEPYEIAGIAPAGFEDPVVGAMDAWLPYDLEADTFSENNSLWVFGGSGRARSAVRSSGRSRLPCWRAGPSTSVMARPCRCARW